MPTADERPIRSPTLLDACAEGTPFTSVTSTKSPTLVPLAKSKKYTKLEPPMVQTLFSGMLVITPSTPSCSFMSRSEEHTSELQSLTNLVCRLLLEKKNNQGACTSTTLTVRARNDVQRYTAI